jgi:membrane-associated phospholipid phosphatase
MNIAAIICNLVMLAFTGLVMLTDGPATETGYVVFSLLMVAIPILSVVALSRGGLGHHWPGLPLGGKA